MNINNRLISSLAALLAAVSVSFAQNADTPYSMYGYGILGERATSMQRQMGGVGYAMSSGRQINVMNPASYARMDSLTFLFDLGADASVIWSQEGSVKDHTFGGGLDYVTMKFPICKYMGGSIGLLPVSSVGYAFGNEIRHGVMENQGEGGINEAYIGVAGRYAGFSLGLNASYDFGTISNRVYSTPEGSGRTLFEHIMQIRDWNILLGAQYEFNIGKNNSMMLGVTYSPKKSYHGKTWMTRQLLTVETRPDTVGRMSMSGKYFQPNSVGVGVSFTHERASRLSVEADFTFQQWSKATYSPLYELPDKEGNKSDRVIFDGMNFNDRLKYAVGAEFVPRIRGNYGQRIAYRLGAYYCDDYLNIRGNRVREYGASLGVGLPTPEGKTIINVGLEWRHRSAHPRKMIGENYLNLTIGVNFNEVWFWKRKIQ